MAERNTGFHPLDADWTRGRALAIGEANAQARMEIALARRKVSFIKDAQ